MLRSQVCTHESLMSPELLRWADELRPAWDIGGPPGRATLMHRKMWEWLFVARALEERGMLEPGMRGLGFGVGHEPLVAAFAARGCEIVATDLDPARAAAGGWVETEQHSSGLSDLNLHGLCDPDAFAERVSFRVVDMTDIPDDLRDFDFAWSLCALEHLGTLARGMDFVVQSMECVRPGGVVAHTTEFNVSSNRTTVRNGPTVLYRKRDIARLERRLRRAGHDMQPVDFTLGSTPADEHVDVPPFTDTHLRVDVAAHTATSLALVICRGPNASGAAEKRRGRHTRLPLPRLHGSPAGEGSSDSRL